MIIEKGNKFYSLLYLLKYFYDAIMLRPLNCFHVFFLAEAEYVMRYPPIVSSIYKFCLFEKQQPFRYN